MEYTLNLLVGLQSTESRRSLPPLSHINIVHINMYNPIVIVTVTSLLVLLTWTPQETSAGPAPPIDYKSGSNITSVTQIADVSRADRQVVSSDCDETTEFWYVNVRGKRCIKCSDVCTLKDFSMSATCFDQSLFCAKNCKKVFYANISSDCPSMDQIRYRGFNCCLNCIEFCGRVSIEDIKNCGTLCSNSYSLKTPELRGGACGFNKFYHPLNKTCVHCRLICQPDNDQDYCSRNCARYNVSEIDDVAEENIPADQLLNVTRSDSSNSTDSTDAPNLQGAFGAANSYADAKWFGLLFGFVVVLVIIFSVVIIYTRRRKELGQKPAATIIRGDIDSRDVAEQSEQSLSEASGRSSERQLPDEEEKQLLPPTQPRHENSLTRSASGVTQSFILAIEHPLEEEPLPFSIQVSDTSNETDIKSAEEEQLKDI